jgi:hypothetical protein
VATVRLKVHSRRWFCDVPACHRQIFAQRFDGVLAPLRVFVAVPVARPQTVDSPRREADEVVEPEPLLAVGIHSQDLPPPDDREIQRILTATQTRTTTAAREHEALTDGNADALVDVPIG